MNLNKFQNKTKSQGAVEFMVILAFVLVLITLVMYSVASFTVDIQENEKNMEIDDFAKSIVSEFEMLQKVEEGYSRNITIPYHLAKRFKPEINSSYLIIEDTENEDDETNNKHYYPLPENSSYSLTNDTEGNYYIIVTRDITTIYDGISLIESNNLGTTSTPTSYASCTLDGTTKAHGDNYYFFNTTSVPYGDSCSSSLRTCNNGNYDGDITYIYSNCEEPSNPFISVWNTSAISVGSSTATQVKLPLESTGTYNFLVEWGDGTNNTITTWNQAETTHTYSSSGIYEINISGQIRGFRFNNAKDKLKILEIKQWGDLNLGNSGSYFFGCSNLNSTTTDALNLTGTTNLSQTFRGTSNFNGNINISFVNNTAKTTIAKPIMPLVIVF